MKRVVCCAALCLCVGFSGSLVQAPAAQAAGKAKCSTGPGVEMKAPDGARLRVLLDLNVERIPVSAPFMAGFTICGIADNAPKSVKLDATMPAHGHGMNYEAGLKKVGQERYVADHLLFHMPGVWRFELIVRQSGNAVRFVHDVTVE